MAFATIEDVQIYAPDVDTGDETESAKVDTLLEQAEDMLSIEFPDLLARVGDGRTPLIRVVRVESEMVAAVMNNPRARQSESQTVGGLSSSFTVNLAVASGLLQLTDAHRALLRGVSQTSGSGGAFTIRPGSGHPPRAVDAER